ncbi:MAG: phosphoserine transaminase [Alphaproteobacteria bacterium]|nr:phosphoserine transaminase [Alphaproteobacteria bacterium]NDC55964.1 phosphoserine transaminase [Alphaproteobacteria bacterium]NDG04194.1 phosphoserine transaminase [Alphaproteobacteria bacterium]
MSSPKPTLKPKNPNFSCGPAAKRPGWNISALHNALLGRSHRSKAGKAKLAEVVEKSRKLMRLPDDYVLGIVAASDTGAVEMAMWNLLGARPCDVFAWEAFGKDWVTDAVKQLKVPHLRTFVGDYGQLPDLSPYNGDHDCVFTWNGTASGVKIPNADWIPEKREGLTICDATSAVFAMEIDWRKVDVLTYSWQKVLGGEAQHGMLALSPRAVQRLESYKPSWPVPKIFRMTKDGKLNMGIFKDEPINTPSMLCVEDVLDALNWAESLGGLPALIARSQKSFGLIADWVARTPWVEFLCADPACRSNTSVTLRFADAAITSLSREAQMDFAKQLVGKIEKEGAGYDFNHYRDAPAGLRLWTGGTVEPDDVAALLPWIDWAYADTRATLQLAA